MLSKERFFVWFPRNINGRQETNKHADGEKESVSLEPLGHAIG